MLLLPLACTSARVPHPEAKSEVLGVRGGLHAATFQQLSLDPKSATESVHAVVVRIATEHMDGTAWGSGIVVCQSGTNAFVLTARHVLTGDDGAGGGDSYFVDGYRFEFFRNVIQPVSGSPEALTVRLVDGADLALVQLPLPRSSVPFTPIRLGRAAVLHAGDRVRTVGNPAGGVANWQYQSGRVIASNGLLEYTPVVPKGFSGGPVVDQSDQLVGINTRNQLRKTATAIPIESAYERVRAWLPASCPRGSW